MSKTLPQPSTGTREAKERIRRVVSERGLVGAANDTKWGYLLDTMRRREEWRPSYRYKCVDGPVSPWGAEWWYNLPLPMMSVEWFDVCYIQETSRGMLRDPEVINHSDWITKILQDAGFCYDTACDIIRIHGYLPKSFDCLDSIDRPVTRE